MVRINLIPPKSLSDQHLIAEYDEILMLLGYVKRYPLKEDIPPTFRLGIGHIRFFKDKLVYLQKRHELIKKEMRTRGFQTNITISLTDFPKNLHNDWKPSSDDIVIIKNRIREKLKKKPGYYRYYGETKETDFLLSLLD